jgi:hypothetical protein
VLAVLALAGGVAGPASAAGPLPPIKHVFIIMLENKSFDTTWGFLSPAPYLAWNLPSNGAFVPNYYSVTHLSNANYVALISGQGANPQNQADCQTYTEFLPGTIGPHGQALGTGCVYPKTVKTVANQLAAKGLTWKGYMQDMGNAAGERKRCAHPALNSQDSTQSARTGDQYAARHNPFVYFHSIIDTPSCAKDDVPLTALSGDLRSARTTPNYSMIVPNLCNDGHDSPCVDGKPGGLTSADRFLRTWVPRIRASTAYRNGGLLVITFDENDSADRDASACCNEPQFPNTPNNGGPFVGRGGGKVGAVVLSPYIDPGTIDLGAYNHFSFLRSVEDLFGLSHLGYASQPGLRAFGSKLFTCYRSSRPKPRRGRLPRGSEIKLAEIGQGTARHPLALVKLWFAGRVHLRVTAGHRRRGRGRSAVTPQRTLRACQQAEIRLPFLHGTAIVTARAFGGIERRRLRF